MASFDVGDAQLGDDELDTVDLKSEIRHVKENLNDERLLLVKTLNWEDNIIIDVNNQQSRSLASSNSDVIVNERVKNAGWVASGEHRNMLSFQSKVLGMC